MSPDTIEKKLTARLKQVGPEFIVFELTIYDPTICGELILPLEQFRAFVREQNVSIISETEEEVILNLKLSSLA